MIQDLSYESERAGESSSAVLFTTDVLGFGFPKVQIYRQGSLAGERNKLRKACRNLEIWEIWEIT